MNIIEIQDSLKDLPDNALMQEMQMPTGSAPQFLVLSELKRRKRMRDEYQRRQNADMKTVAEETITAAGMPQGGIMDAARAMAPQTNVAQNTGMDTAIPTVPTQAPQPEQPMMMAKGGIVSLRTGGKLVNFRGREFAVFEDGEVYRVLPNGKRLKEPSPAVRRMVIEETTKMLGDRRDQTVVDVEQSGLEAFEAAQSPSVEVEKELSFLDTLREGADVREAAKTAGITLLEAANIVAGSAGLLSREFQKATLRTIQDFVPNKDASRKIQSMIDGITEIQKEYFGEGNIVESYVPRATGESLIQTKSAREKKEEAARAAYEEQQTAETMAALGDEGEYDRLSNLLQGQAGPIPVAPGAISVADTMSSLPFATGEMYEAPIAAPDPTAATPQNLNAIQRPTPPASVLQAPSAAPTSGSDAELFGDLQGIRAAKEAEIKRQKRQDDIYKFLADPSSAAIADRLDEANLEGDEKYRKRILEGNLAAHTGLFFPKGSSGQEVARKDVNLRALQFLQGDQFTPPSEIYSDLLGGDARATARFQEEPSSVIDQISDRLYREAQQGELAKQEQLFGDYDAEAQAQRDAEIAGQRDVLEQIALARAGERLKDQQPTKDLTGIAGTLKKGLDYVGDPALNYLEGAIGKFGELVESGQQKVGDYFDARRAMESDEANLGAGNQIIDPSQTAKAREDAATAKAVQDIADIQGSITSGGVSGAGFGSLDSRITKMLADRQKQAESDKWMALAYAGMELMKPTSTIGEGLGKAGQAGLGYLTQAKKGMQDFETDMLKLQTQLARAAGSSKSGALTLNQYLSRGEDLITAGQKMLENAGDNADAAARGQDLIDRGMALISIVTGGGSASSGGAKTVNIS